VLRSSFSVDSSALDVQHIPTANDVPLAVTLTTEIGPHVFNCCPICLKPEPTEREHLPPESMGGQVQTRTCVPCNNRLGSLVEGDLASWYIGEVRQARISSPSSGVPGSRRFPRSVLRWTPDGKFVLFGIKPPALAARQMVASGEFELTHEIPDPRLYHIAALKQAYLAACLQLRAIPETGSAEAIRRDLIAARDAPNRGSVSASAIADAMTVARSFERPDVPPMTMCTFKGESIPEAPGILLAGAFLVSWPFPDVPPSSPE
jgi:hypothetical protein